MIPNIETLAIHAGRELHFGERPASALAPSPILSTSFERAADGS